MPALLLWSCWPVDGRQAHHSICCLEEGRSVALYRLEQQAGTEALLLFLQQPHRVTWLLDRTPVASKAYCWEI
jgi:hypothetical protein